MKAIYEILRALSQEEQFLWNEPMSRHTTFRVGGPADLMYFPESEAQVCAAMEAARSRGIPVLVMGNGSNMIVRDGGVRGLVIVLGERFSQVLAEGSILTGQAGASLAKVASVAQGAALSGLEFVSGIPGSLGGGCTMNAGAYGGQLSDVLLDARVLQDGEVCTLTREEMEMGYRMTRPLRTGGIVLSARFALRPGDGAEILATMKELNARRREKQPLNFPSAGSVFKRPEGHFAGALIEQAGLKGTTVGGAQVSCKHAGFIINLGGATASDILTLIERIQNQVLARFGVRLEPEVRIIGE